MINILLLLCESKLKLYILA